MSSDLQNEWWYYTVQKPDGDYYKGIYRDDMVLLPRKNLAKIDLKGRSALDICTMEGLMPSIMCKSGASEVFATDSARPGDYPEEGNDTIKANTAKMAEIKRIHNIEFDYSIVPQKTTVFEHMKEKKTNQFDLINLSGLLYHVYSPMHWIGSVRPLVKNGGLAIISTNVTFDEKQIMLFNDKGCLQQNLTTYWYISVPLFDYMLRYFRLRPIRAEYSVYEDGHGYLSVICRAEPNVIADADDPWMEASAWHSWDSKWFGGLEMVHSAQKSDIAFKDGKELGSEVAASAHVSRLKRLLNGKKPAVPKDRLSLIDFVKNTKPTPFYGESKHTAVLNLNDVE